MLDAIPSVGELFFCALFLYLLFSFTRSGVARADNDNDFQQPQQQQEQPPPDKHEIKRCANPDCVRCRNYANFTVAALRTALEFCQHAFARADFERLHDALSLHTYSSGASVERLAAPLQRPTVFFVPDLPSQPVWNVASLQHVVAPLTAQFAAIRAEIDQLVARDSPRGWQINDTHEGVWRVFPLISQGVVNERNANELTHTFAALQAVPDACCASDSDRSCFGNAFVSVLEPGCCIEPHCGPTNARLRLHLPLHVPQHAHYAPTRRRAQDDDNDVEDKVEQRCEIRVAGIAHRWAAGEAFLFDDSYQHSVENSTSGSRTALIVDFWNPHLAPHERFALTTMFPAH